MGKTETFRAALTSAGARVGRPIRGAADALLAALLNPLCAGCRVTLESPLNGPVRVADHPNNAPATGFPDLRGRTIDRIAADVQCAGTGFFPGIATNTLCPNPVPLADNEISARVPRTNERRPDPRYGTNLLISNGAESWYDGLEVEWTKRLSGGSRSSIVSSICRSSSLLRFSSWRLVRTEAM